MAVTTYEAIAFLLFAAITLGSSIGVVLVRDVWHAALLLGVALLSVAVHFVMLRAEFLAAMQVLVYVGGVLILISFAIMLIRRQNLEDIGAIWPQLNLGAHLLRGVLAIALFGVFTSIFLRASFGTPTGFPADASITESIGRALFNLGGADVASEGFLVSFEIIDVVLVAALVGAVMLARREPSGRLLGGVRSNESTDSRPETHVNGGDRE